MSAANRMRVWFFPSGRTVEAKEGATQKAWSLPLLQADALLAESLLSNKIYNSATRFLMFYVEVNKLLWYAENTR